MLTPSGFRSLLRAERPFARPVALIRHVLTTPFQRRSEAPATSVQALARRLRDRGQRLELAFSGDEPLHEELVRSGDAESLVIHALPLRSHTLKPLQAQRAAHAILDAAVERAAQ